MIRTENWVLAKTVGYYSNTEPRVADLKWIEEKYFVYIQF